MSKLDITRCELSVKEYLSCHEGFLTRRFIPHSSPRPSDALIFILGGSCKYFFDDGFELEAKCNGILYLARGSVYQMDVNCDKYEFLVVNFNFETDEKCQSGFYAPLSPAATERLFSRLCFRRVGGISFAKTMSLIYQIIDSVCESSDRAYIGSDARAKIEKAADLIHLNFADSRLSVASIAHGSGFSEVYFRKLFALRFGQSPSRYIMQTRVSNAIKLMAFDGLSIEEIAEKSGFSSIPYFSKVFKSFTGEAPAAYRRAIAKRNYMT